MNSRWLSVDSQYTFIETRKIWWVRIFILYSVFFYKQCLKRFRDFVFIFWPLGVAVGHAKLKSRASFHFTWNVNVILNLSNNSVCKTPFHRYNKVVRSKSWAASGLHESRDNLPFLRCKDEAMITALSSIKHALLTSFPQNWKRT